MALGQRIYTLTSNNANELANITIDDGARTEIQQALNLGLEVTVHQSPITVNGWQGSGYAILDAEYGVGAYQISGGVSGGAITALIWSLFGAWATIASAAVLVGLLSALSFTLVGVTTAIATIAIVFTFLSTVRLVLALQESCGGIQYAVAAFALAIYGALGLLVPPWITAIMAGLESSVISEQAC